MRTVLFKERGQALVLIALAAIGMIAAVALGVDGSAKFSDRRHAQNAADTAALTGALSFTQNKTSACGGGTNQQWQCDALTIAQTNGYNRDLVTNRVWVGKCSDPTNDSTNYPLRYQVPVTCGSAYEGNGDYVQVVITTNVNTYFARLIGINQTHNTVQAVALATQPKTLGDGAMIISYDPDPNCSTGGTGGYSVQVTGSAIVKLTGGGIFLNSDEVCGFKIPNCADLQITNGGSINTVGSNNIDTTGCTLNPVPNKNYNQDPVDIPNDIYWPDVPPECSTAAPTPTKIGVDPSDNKDEWLIYPGYYTDFPQASLIPNNKHIFMKSGVYCIDPPMNQDLSWSGSSFLSLNGSTDPSKNKYANSYNRDGVTLYIRSGGGFSFNINSPILLDASNVPDADYQGYLIILEGNRSSIEDCVLNGGSYLDMNGLIFAPYCDFTINGQAGETAQFNAQIVGWDIKINGTNAINFNYDPHNLVHIKRRIGLMR